MMLGRYLWRITALLGAILLFSAGLAVAADRDTGSRYSLAAGNASGQDAAEERGRIEEIVVTSRRREESLQEIPISMTAITDIDMQEMGVIDTQMIEDMVPNLQIENFGGGRSNIGTVFIRGIGGGHADPTISAGSGFYIDGAYIARASGIFFSTMEVERIEVLRGPQGTLFGKNTTGGAINIIPVRPGPDPEAKAMFRFGNYKTREIRASLNMPLIEDKLFVRVGLAREWRDGYYNIVNQPNGQADDNNLAAMQVAVRWFPTPQWTVDVMANYSHEDEGNLGGDCIFRGDAPNNSTRPESGDPLFGFEEACRASEAAGKRQFFSDIPNFQINTINGIFSTINWQSAGSAGGFDGVGLTIKSSYRKIQNSYMLENGDYTLAALDFRAGTSQNVAKHIEAQFNATAMDNRLDLVFGYYHFDEQTRGEGPGGNCIDEGTTFPDSVPTFVVNPDGTFSIVQVSGERCIIGPVSGNAVFGFIPSNISSFDDDTGLFGGPRGPGPFVAFIKHRARSHAFFAHGKFEIIPDTLTVDAGIRWTSETRSFTNREFVLTNSFFGFEAVINDDTLIANNTGKDTWTAWTPMASVSYALPGGGVVDQANIYFTYAKGFLSGGFNTELNEAILANSTDPVGALEFLQYEPEKVRSLEVGFKSTWGNGRLRLNVALFHTQYKNKQQEIEFEEGFGDVGDDTLELLANAANATIKGLEIELTARPVGELQIQAAYGYLKSSFSELATFPFPVATFAQVGDPLGQFPDTLSANIQYQLFFGDGHSLTPRFNMFWKDTYVRAQGAVCTQNAYSKYDARLTYEPPDGNYQIAFFAFNFTNKDILRECPTSGSRGTTVPKLEAPATYGIEINARF